MRLKVLLPTLSLAAIAAIAPAAPKGAPKPAPRAPAKPLAFAPAEFDLAPGESYRVELFVPSPTGKAFTGTLAFAPAAGLSVRPDARWTGKVPPWGVKTYPVVTAAADADGTLPLKAAIGGLSATLPVRVVAPTFEPVPGHRKLTVRLTNPFRARVLHGRVLASNPDRFLQDITTREFRIPAGQAGEVEFPLPGAAAAEGETYDFTLTVETYQGFRRRQTFPLAFPPQDEK